MIKTLSLTPLVFEIENFLDPEETAHIREGAYVLTGVGGGCTPVHHHRMIVTVNMM